VSTAVEIPIPPDPGPCVFVFCGRAGAHEVEIALVADSTHVATIRTCRVHLDGFFPGRDPFARWTRNVS
jgi:hypothetical protein